MNKNKTTIIIVISLIALAVLGVFLVYGFIAGGKKNDPHNVVAALSMWGVDDEDDYGDIFAAWKTVYPNVTITYRKFADEHTYEATLVNALAAGQGPDIFAVLNTNARKTADKIFPLPAAYYTVGKLRTDFPDTVVRDFAYRDLVYALPLSVDTLALLYNQDLFNAAGVALPPATWDEVRNIAPSLTKYGTSTVTQSAIALGGTGNIPNAKDIISALWYEGGVEVVNDAYTSAAFGAEQAVSAFDFYLKFAEPSSSLYTWNDTLPSARDMFAEGKLAMLIDYDEGRAVIAEKSPFVRIGVAELPAADGTKATFARYWGYAVARQSKQPYLAWEFVREMTTNRGYAERYMAKSSRPPALRALIAKYAGSGTVGVFARQALVGKAWQDPARDETASIFSDMIREGRTATFILPVLQSAAAKITNLITPRF